MTRTQLLSLATFATLSLLSGAPRAEDEKAIADDNATSRSEALSCAEEHQAAWFYRQLQLTEGDVSPEVTSPAACGREPVQVESAK
jgi:hypothetical protein